MAASPTQGWLGYIAGILKAFAGSTASPSTAADVATTATKATSASLGLGITSDIGEGFKAVSAVAGLVQQRDKELNTPEMVQAQIEANKKKAIDKIERDVANEDLEAERKDAA